MRPPDPSGRKMNPPQQNGMGKYSHLLPSRLIPNYRHAVNTALICRMWYPVTVSAIQSGKKTVPLPLVLIAHRDPELNINWRLDSIISMQQLQDVQVNIKSLCLGAVHWNSQKLDWKYWEIN